MPVSMEKDARNKKLQVLHQAMQKDLQEFINCKLTRFLVNER